MMILIEVPLCLTVFFLICLHLYLESRKRHRKYSEIPSIQPRLPVFGNALSLRMPKCHLKLSEWADVYGPVYRVRLYNQEVLVLNDFESIHEALVVRGSDFAGRPSGYRTHHDDRHAHSIVWQTYTKKLRFLRKEVLRSLRTSVDGGGECDGGLEEKCRPEIKVMLDRMGSHRGTGTFDPWDYVYEAVSNVMLGLTLNQRFDSSSQSFQQLKSINQLFNEIYGSGSARDLDLIPLLPMVRHFRQFRKLKYALRLRDEFWERELLNLKTRGLPTCIVQRLLSLASSDNNNDDDGDEEKTAKEVFTNLILAGTDTTATALTTLLLVFLHKPEVQEAMWEELSRHVGSHRAIRLADGAQLPYCQAVLLELLRFISHVPLAVPHCTMRDTRVLGKVVPCGMTVYINLWSLHHNSADWPDPWTFKPSRFLDEQGGLVPPSHPNRKRLMVFGAGRRVCVGEVLARNRLFLFATSLVQRFHFIKAGDHDGGNMTSRESQLPPLDPRTFEMGLVIHPPSFKMAAHERCSSYDTN